MKLSKFSAAVIFPVCLFAISAFAKPARSQSLTLLAACPLQSALLGPQAVYADGTNTFLATNEGNLIVMSGKSPYCTRKATIPTSPLPLYAVIGDGNRVYVACADGNVYIYSQTAPFQLLKIENPSGSGFPVRSVMATAGKTGTYAVTYWQGMGAADATHYFDSELNGGDSGQVFNDGTDASLFTFGSTFDPGVTDVFNRTNGALVGSIPNPTTMSGAASQVAIYTNPAIGIVALTTPGPNGKGVVVYNSQTSKTPKFMYAINEPYADSVTTVNNSSTYAVGTEAGQLALWNSTNCHTPVRRAVVDLWTTFGNPNIELRSLSNVGDMVYAGSSGGTTPTDPNNPEYLVFKVGK